MKTIRPHIPPKWVGNFLKLFLDARTLEASLGDLEEKFQSRLYSGSPLWKAKFFFVMEGLGFLKMARQPRLSSLQATASVLNHTLLFFGRLVKRDPIYYVASLVGLTLSLASFMLIMLFIHDELSYDRFHEKRDRIFRLTTHLKLSDVEYDMATSAFPAAAAIQAEVPEVERTVRVYPQEMEFMRDERKFPERIVMADNGFFDVFSFTWLMGNRQTALEQPASIVFTESMATKYFGHENPLGQTLAVYDQLLTVTGVVADVPEQSHLKFDAIVPLALQLDIWKSQTGLEGRENKWLWIAGAYTYVLLQDKASVGPAAAKLPRVVDKYFPDRYRQNGALRLQALSDIHLTSGLSNELEPGGNMLYIRLFAIVAFVVMLVSAINLINLSNFKISSRMREVGIRKFLGQSAARIVMQLSAESVLVGMLACCLAALLCFIFLPQFNQLVQKNLYPLSKTSLIVAGATFTLIAVICLAAVVRPAMRYAARSSRSLLLLKGSNAGHGGERNALIGLQVCFSFVLLVFSFIVGSQIDFFKSKDLGFEKRNVVLVELNDDIYGHEALFKQELLKSSAIMAVSGGAIPGETHNGWRFVPEGSSADRPFLFPMAWVDADYLNTLKIKLLFGEGFKSNVQESDSLWPFLINERAAIELGWLDDPIGKRMKVFAAGTTEIMAEGRVIGVMKDYHFESLHRPVKPVVLTASPGYGTALIRISGQSLDETIAYIGATWKQFTDKPFSYNMLDEKLDRLYVNEAKLDNLILFFTFLALYLTCYGMFAMSSLLFSSRLREVAIRKVLGADRLTIIKQFYSRYAIFNLVAIIMGVPIAIYLGNRWLEVFQYRIELDASFFVKAGGCVLLVGLLSVSYYLLRMACSNPVKFLRSE